jgi:hypothetical protein
VTVDIRVSATREATRAAAAVIAGDRRLYNHDVDCPVRATRAPVQRCDCWVWARAVDTAGRVLMAVMPDLEVRTLSGMSMGPCEIDGTWTATRCPVCNHAFCGDHLADHEADHTEDERVPEMVRRARAERTEGD